MFCVKEFCTFLTHFMHIVPPQTCTFPAKEMNNSDKKHIIRLYLKNFLNNIYTLHYLSRSLKMRNRFWRSMQTPVFS